MSSIVITVGRRLRAYRLKQGLTQEALAEKASLHPTYIGQVERGEKNLTLESLERICLALSLSFVQLFEGMEPAQNPQSPSTARQCREIIEQMSEEAQLHILNILREIYHLRPKK